MQKLFFVVLITATLILSTPVVAVTEYKIQGTEQIIGYSEDVGLNISYSSMPPLIGNKIYQDGFNSTWCIPPFNSPDGKMDIVIVPVEQSGFWEWLTSWI